MTEKELRDALERSALEGVLHGIGLRDQGYELNRAHAEAFAIEYTRHAPELRELCKVPPQPAEPTGATQPIRRRVVAEIERALTLFPELRLGQLIGNAMPDLFGTDPFYREDDDLASDIKRYVDFIQAASHPAEPERETTADG